MLVSVRGVRVGGVSGVRCFSAVTTTNVPVSTEGRPLLTQKSRFESTRDARTGNSYSGVTATTFGATGFLGRYVVNYLTRVGSQVVVPYRDDGMSARDLKVAELGQVVPMPYDLTDYSSLEKTLFRSNVAINLIGRRYQTGLYGFDDNHVYCAHRLAKAARESGVERFIHISALGADIKSESAFLRSKARGEQAVRDIFPNATILRPAPIFGLDDHFISYYCKYGRRLIAIPVANAQQRIQPVFAGDVAWAILQAINYDDTQGRTYELVGPEIVTVQNLVQLVSERSRRDMRVFQFSSEAAKRVYGSLVGGVRVLSSSPVGGPVKALTREGWAGRLLNKMSFPNLFNNDMVHQGKVDLVATPGANTLEHLGVLPTPLGEEIDFIVQPYVDLNTLGKWKEIQRTRSAATPIGHYETKYDIAHTYHLNG